MNNLKTDKFYINGQWVAPKASQILEVIDPATEQPLCNIALGNQQDVDAAVNAAKEAFTSYSTTPVKDRIELLEKILTVYKRRYDEMAGLICKELGAPMFLSEKAQAKVGEGHLEATISALKNFDAEYKNEEGDLIIREPIGVCGLITPWNWPINQIALKVFPAIAVGCTVVLKPSEVTPLNALLFAEILDEAGVPAGVFNLVNGDGISVGAALSRHPDVQMMSFTGSTRAGTNVSKDAADTVKRVTLELGGKSPNIIFPDADLKRAIKQGILQCFLNTGQNCNAPTRMLIHQSQYDEAKVIAAEVVSKILVDDPTKQGRHLGPVVSKQQFDRIQTLMQIAIDEGASLVAGGLGRPDGFEKGYFVRPTVFADVDNSATICQEEVFGPVLVMISYEDENDAIGIANDTPYGLAAYVQTADETTAMRVMRRLRAGMVRINGSDIGYLSPFGGFKLSGNGREGGSFGLEDFCEVKAVAYPDWKSQ